MANSLLERPFGIIPAYTGSSSGKNHLSFPVLDHPRIHGEQAGIDLSIRENKGSSPHTRGAARLSAAVHGDPRIIPAYTGSSNSDIRSLFVASDHPRIHGEQEAVNARRVDASGSSPHTRGAAKDGLSWAHMTRIIPAYTGSRMLNGAQDWNQ